MIGEQAPSHKEWQSELFRALEHSIEHAAHYLPTQGPISVFVHHNTLHALEDLPFDAAVRRGHGIFHAEPYLSEERYHQELERGRITIHDLEAELLDELGDEYDLLLSVFGTRFSLRMSMLRSRIHFAKGSALKWALNETTVLSKFQVGAPERDKTLAIKNFKRWVASIHLPEHRSILESAKQLLQIPISENSSDSIWESFYLKFLFHVCLFHAHTGSARPAVGNRSIRPRDIVYQKTGHDADLLVNEQLIKFCSAFTDQGFANIPLPEAKEGFAISFAKLYSRPLSVLPTWMKRLKPALKAILTSNWSPLMSITDTMHRLKIRDQDRDEFIQQTLMALPGWAGMIWQLETNVPWAPHTVPQGSLHEYLAIRMLLDEVAAAYLDEPTLYRHSLSLRRTDDTERLSVSSDEEIAFVIFQLAQLRGWDATQIISLNTRDWSALVSEVRGFDSISRRSILHKAFERNYRQSALNAFAVHSQERRRDYDSKLTTRSCYQVVTCIDDREESLRRHLEEIEPSCETYAAAGFYAVAMYYQGGREAFYRPLCPINIVPKHYVREEPLFSAESNSAKSQSRRRLVGRLSQNIHFGSRSLLGGSATALLGSIASVPMITRILMPRLTSRFRSLASVLFEQPATELHIERETEQPGKENGALGYSLSEMSDIVVRILQDIGLTKHFAPIVLFLGHGSSSLNNPHESAYNCGACSGGRGGPNARAFATMANDPRVRKLVKDRGIDVPDDVCFLGGYHNTCNDAIDYFDLDSLPRSHRPIFRKLEADLNSARAANAHERSRRFFSVPTDATLEEALAAVEQRSEDLSQARPEYNHATNAMCYVGKRDWTRGLFMDRRSFLVSYDPDQDDQNASILARILAAAIPVCGGISLEYYFSTVDNEVYGCGSKLPHNIVSLSGVMTGAASDLRPGLSAQMVEIHEPMRILFLIETTPEKMHRIIDQNSQIKQLVENNWVQLATFQIDTGVIQRYVNGTFQTWTPTNSALPRVISSLEWYQGKREHLDFAQIVNCNRPVQEVAQ